MGGCLQTRKSLMGGCLNTRNSDMLIYGDGNHNFSSVPGVR